MVSRNRMFGVLFISILFCCISFAANAVEVIDGDTLESEGVIYRLEGIDAPEYGQKCNARGGSKWACGEAASNRLRQLVENTDVICAGIGRDDYQRVIARCKAGEIDVGQKLVLEGLDWAFVKYSDTYVEEEAEARRKSIGIWQTTTLTAWEFRAERWSKAASVAPEGCPIKGNISKNGRIAHPPWSPWYERTRINRAKGERWFCSEADALAAGWRLPRWN